MQNASAQQRAAPALMGARRGGSQFFSSPLLSPPSAKEAVVADMRKHEVELRKKLEVYHERIRVMNAELQKEMSDAKELVNLYDSINQFLKQDSAPPSATPQTPSQTGGRRRF